MGGGGVECNCHMNPPFLAIGWTNLAGERCHVWFVIVGYKVVFFNLERNDLHSCDPCEPRRLLLANKQTDGL